LDPLPGFPGIGLFAGRVLQFDEGERQAVDEDDKIGTESLGRPLDRELVDDEKLLASMLAKSTSRRSSCLTVSSSRQLTLMPGEERAVKVAVALFGDGMVELEQALHRLVEHGGGHAGIEPCE